MQTHAVEHLTTATTVTALPAAQAGWRWKVVGLHISVGGATVITVSFSATNQRVYDLAANQTIDLGVMDWEGDPAAALSVTSSSAVTADVTVDAVTEVAQ